MSKPNERAKRAREAQRRQEKISKGKLKGVERSNGLSKPGPRRETKRRYLIVCEGAKTEPYYFEGLKASERLNVDVEIYGAGMNTTGLIGHALTLRAKYGPFDEVWCVFDRDSFPAASFKNALSQAAQNKIKVAYTNEAFELWYLLHFEYSDVARSRREYAPKLDGYLGKKYQKNDRGLYQMLKPKQGDALRNAEQLLAKYDPRDPERDNPSTTVHALVEALLSSR